MNVCVCWPTISTCKRNSFDLYSETCTRKMRGWNIRRAHCQSCSDPSDAAPKRKGSAPKQKKLPPGYQEALLARITRRRNGSHSRGTTDFPKMRVRLRQKIRRDKQHHIEYTRRSRPIARVAELADATDLKSVDLRILGVRVPPWAPAPIRSRPSLESPWTSRRRRVRLRRKNPSIFGSWGFESPPGHQS